jgi:nucleotide-binding universal stress UspA family protein
VILRAYVPVLIVRAYEPVADELSALHYRRLLVPLDGSQRAECVLPVARALSSFHNCTLLLAHVVNEPEVPRHAPLSEEEEELVNRLVERNRDAGEAYLQDLKSRLSNDVETRLLVGDNASAALHELVDREEIDLVLLSAHGYTGAAQWPYGSVALNFIAYGATPLLIVQDLPEGRVRRTRAEEAAAEEKGH